MKTAADLLRKLLKNKDFYDEFINDLKENPLQESVDETEYFFHATYECYLRSIEQNEILCNPKNKTWEGCKNGVICLAKDIDEAASYAEATQDENDDIADENIVVLRIDPEYIDSDFLAPYSNIIWDEDTISTAYEYSKDIPPEAIVQVIFYR